jgi:hypothetical protein
MMTKSHSNLLSSGVLVNLGHFEENIKQVVFLQKVIRGWLGRKRFLELLREFKTSSESLMVRQRNCIIKEIISTEGSYLKQLNALIEVSSFSFPSPFVVLLFVVVVIFLFLFFLLLLLFTSTVFSSVFCKTIGNKWTSYSRSTPRKFVKVFLLFFLHPSPHTLTLSQYLPPLFTLL